MVALSNKPRLTLLINNNHHNMLPRETPESLSIYSPAPHSYIPRKDYLLLFLLPYQAGRTIIVYGKAMTVFVALDHYSFTIYTLIIYSIILKQETNK